MRPRPQRIGLFMVIVLISDCQVKATRLRHLLAQNGYDCPQGAVVPLEAVENQAWCFHPKPDLILLVLSHDVERSAATIQRLRDCSDVSIVAVGPRDPNLILGALRAGATSYLDDSGDLQTEMAAALARVCAAERRPAPLGHLTTVVAASGGCGRTLLATNLAVALAMRRQRCALFDIDLERADAATYLNLKARHTIADLCRNMDKLDPQMLEQSLVEHESGVSVLAGPENWDEIRHVTGEGLKKILRAGRALYPDVVVDLGSFWMGDMVHPLQESTSIILLVRFDFAAIRNARRALTCFERNGIDRSHVLLVAARHGRQKEISMPQVEAALGMKIRHTIPEDPHAASSSVNCGVPLIVETPGSEIAKAIRALADAVGEHQAANGRSAAETSPNNGFVKKVRSFLGLSLRELQHAT